MLRPIPAIVASFIGSVFALFGATAGGLLIALTLNFNIRPDEGLGLFIMYTSPVIAYIIESEPSYRVEWRHLYWVLNIIVFSCIALALRRSAFSYYAERRWQDR